MESIGLLFKVFWAPGEAMSRVSQKKGSALAPILLLSIVGMITSVVMFTHLDIGEIFSGHDCCPAGHSGDDLLFDDLEIWLVLP